MTYEKENHVLTTLVDINKDASDFYKSASQKVQNPNLERSFNDLERIHNTVVIDLTKRIKDNGGKPSVDGTFVGKTTRVFGELMTKISTDVDETLVSHLEEAEDRCLHSIRDAIDDKNLRADTKALLVDEMSTLQRSHDYMKALKESMKAAA